MSYASRRATTTTGLPVADQGRDQLAPGPASFQAAAVVITTTWS